MSKTKYAPIEANKVPSDVVWNVPGRLAGQIVEVAYGGFGRSEKDDGDPYRRVTDQSLQVDDPKRVSYLRRIGIDHTTSYDRDGDAHVMLPVAAGRPYDEGINDRRWRLVLVRGYEYQDIRAWDSVAEHYSVHHDLTDDEKREARRLARAGRPAEKPSKVKAK